MKPEHLKTIFGTAEPFSPFETLDQALTSGDQLPDEIRAKLFALYELAAELVTQRVKCAPVLTSWTRLIDYLHLHHAWQPVEQFRVLFLDRKNTLIASEVMGQGTIDHAPVYPREVVKRALQLNAAHLIFAHNHPSGDATPSNDDQVMTRRLVEALATVEITVHDHIVIGRFSHASMRQLGLMS